MATNDWAYYAQCSRLKTKRTKKRLQKTESDKKLIRLHKELDNIEKCKNELGYVTLDPPIQKGWKRFYTLKHDVLASKDALFYQTLLDKINIVELSYRRDFKVKKRKYGKKFLEVKPHKPLEFSDYCFHRFKLTEKEKSYFKQELVFITKQSQHTINHVFVDSSKFILTIKPNMITHIKVIDPVLEQAHDRIQNHLNSHCLYPRLRKLLYGNSKYKFTWKREEKAKYKTIINDFLQQEIFHNY